MNSQYDIETICLTYAKSLSKKDAKLVKKYLDKRDFTSILDIVKSSIILYNKHLITNPESIENINIEDLYRFELFLVGNSDSLNINLEDFHYEDSLEDVSETIEY